MLSEKQDSAEAGGASERSRERDDEDEQDRNGSRAKGTSSQTQTKTKDVSHVPCKFFRLNQCTAGSSCPFSHHMLEPGQQKDVCQWFLKGNCKFGHKCALAHVLPGQPMSMDRKNKKAAQQAAQAVGGSGNNGSAKPERRKGASSKEESLRVGLVRGLGKSAAPIPISKATLSPSAPAPPLRDTDFPLGHPDNFTQHVQKSSDRHTSAHEKGRISPGEIVSNDEKTPAPPPPLELVPSASTSPTRRDVDGKLPVSKPTPTRGLGRQNGSMDFGFGPIGSPPRSSPAHTPKSQTIPQSIHRVNGFSPSTSPSPAGALGVMPSTSPFSAPGSKSLFMSYSLDRDAAANTQIKTSGAASAAPPNFGGPMSLGVLRGWDIAGSSALAGVQDDDDLEEFLPSSLNELLTDEEKKRRLSRTGGQRPVLDSQMSSHHRYSRSVPAASLMDNVKSLWNDVSVDVQAGGGPSPSFLGTSNVSTGFLPPRSTMSIGHGISDLPANQPSATLGFNSPGSPSSTGPFIPRTTSNSLAASSQQFSGQQPRPIPGAAEPVFNGNPLSPTARALQEHAPGQSLPQGLAAGLSRIHVRPPVHLGTSTSPHSGLGASPARGLGGGLSPLSNTEFGGGGFNSLGQPGSPPGLSRDFDRFLGSRPNTFNNLTGGISSPMPSPSQPPGLGVRRQWIPSQPLSSPLAGPVITHDDDEMFAME